MNSFAVLLRGPRAAQGLGVQSVASGAAPKRRRGDLDGLNDRQLRDAGIDPVRAGRGKAIATDSATVARLQGLSHG